MTEVTLNTVKVRNWDNTIVTVPPYLLISDSFQNWRPMQDSGGRRVMRSVNIDMNSVRFCTPEMLDRFRKIRLLKDYIDETERLIAESNEQAGVENDPEPVNGLHQTNLGVFRAYLERYLRSLAGINQEMMLMVRQLQPTEKGLPVELYFFSKVTEWTVYRKSTGRCVRPCAGGYPGIRLAGISEPRRQRCAGSERRNLAAGLPGRISGKVQPLAASGETPGGRSNKKAGCDIASGLFRRMSRTGRIYFSYRFSTVFQSTSSQKFFR